MLQNYSFAKNMSQLIPQDNPQATLDPQQDKINAAEAALLTSIPNKIIEITSSKKKKEVIEIHDSEGEEERPTKPIKLKERKPNVDMRKPKRTPIRCVLCKQSGKKVNMKSCVDCKAFFHISCLEQEGELSPRYRCRKCRHKRQGETITTAKKHEKSEKAEDKMAGRRLQKQKRREEQIKKMGFFQERYPYYFQEDKIKFPIEDKLLFIYRELFEITETPRIRPQPHPLIPASSLADFLQIENFFSTFREELKGYGAMPTEIRKDIFYLSLGSQGLDCIFCSLIECLLKVYLSDIFDKNKTDNVRILNDHSFFTLLTHLNDNEELSQEVVIRTASEILRYLATIPSMKRAFEGVEYPSQHTLQAKTSLLVGLIRGLSEIDEFHTLVSIKSEKMQQLTKEKTELIAQLKIDEAQSLSNNEKLKDMALTGRELEQSQDGVTRIMTKEIDKHKKKIQKLASQQTKSQETIRQIRNKINQIGRAMPFLTTEVNFLGLDRNNSEYFFYVREPNRLYVKFRSYLLDTNQDFLIYEGKEVISEVTKQLNTKGLLEKHLYDNITSFIKDDIINNNLQQDASDFILEEQKYTSIQFEQILDMVRETEDTFSTYLSLRQCQWAAPATRELFIQQFMSITDLQILKEQLRSLQENFLFAEYANNDIPEKREDQSEEELRDGREGRKKIPIRIWGINSEKTKKYWLQYLQDCIDVIGIWLCAFIFKNNVEKYVKKKMEAYYDQQLKEQKYRAREGRERGRPPLIKYSDRQQIDRRIVKPPSTFEESEETPEQRRPNLRKRKQKKMNIDSQDDEEDNEFEAEEADQQEENSSNQQCCEQCGEYGEMLCCDTCPKVYHRECLKMVNVPQGEWSCYKCLEKLSNERQTRSRMKKMSRFA